MYKKAWRTCKVFVLLTFVISLLRFLTFSLFSQGRLCTWPHFESEGFWNSEVAYSFVARGDGIPKETGVSAHRQKILHFIILHFRHTVQDFSLIFERFLYDLEMKTREHNKQQTNKNRAI